MNHEQVMRRPILALMLCAISFSGLVAKTAAGAALPADVPGTSTPEKLQEAWLRFHETGLCQQVDSVFIFDANPVEIWTRAENEKSSLKFRELFKPLSDANRVILYSVPFLNGSRANSEKDPPPSLWQNYELRFNLGDSVARNLKYLDVDDTNPTEPSLNNTILKQRLQIYGEQMIDRNRKMEQYAQDIFDLMRMCSDPGIAPGMKAKAAGIALAHSKAMERLVGKITASLSLAIPGSDRGTTPDLKARTAENPGNTQLEKAWRVNLSTRDIARRVYRFIYPENYTVEVNELRNSSLLESMRSLERSVKDFQKTLVKSSWK
jgi:hypothetical protein